jgi:hypothetical protein
MPTLAETFALIRDNAKRWGVYLRPPLTDKAVSEVKVVFEAALNVSFPPEYDRFLTLSNGLGTQRGELFGGADILKWNNEHWNRIPSCRDTPEGVVIESHPDPKPKPIKYLWIGCYGNMDMYSFHLKTRKYRVTNLSFDYVYGSFAKLQDFLLYLSDPKIEFASTVSA